MCNSYIKVICIQFMHVLECVIGVDDNDNSHDTGDSLMDKEIRCVCMNKAWSLLKAFNTD